MLKEEARPKGYSENPMQMYIAPLNFETAVVASQRYFKVAGEAQTNILKRMALMNEEVLNFMDRRLAKDRKAASDLSRCQTPQEMADVCTKFANAALTDYSEEIGVLASAMTEQAQALAEDFQYQIQENN